MNEIEIILEKPLGLVVCSTITNEGELTVKVNTKHLCGTTNGWIISKRKDKVLQCDTYPDRKHWLFTC